MKQKNSRLRFLAAFALMMALTCAMMSGGVFSKYIAQRAVANQIKYTNTLAEEFKLLDQPVTVDEDGSYAKDTSADAQPTDGYTYKLIPGITLPAAPYVEIKGKTEIPAYLYIEVKNTNDDVSLTFDSTWTELSVTGKKGGAVYAYDNGTAITGSGSDTVVTYPTFTVEELSKTPITAEGEIKVYAYMIQKIGDKTAAESFSEAPQP